MKDALINHRLFTVLTLSLAFGMNAMADIPGLVSYWPLDEGSGNVAEELSGKGYSGRILGDIEWVETERGMALRFDGNTTVRVQDSPAWNIGPGEVTFSVWVKYDRQPNPGTILEHAFDKKRGVWILSAGIPPLLSFYDDKLIPGGIRFPGFTPGKWQHLVLVWRRAEDGSMTSYVNGARAATLTVGVTEKQIGDLYFGSMHTANYFKGQLKEVAIFNRALSAAQIQSIYTDGIRLASPAVVSSLVASKVLYDSKESGSARVRVRNVSDAAQSIELVMQLVSGIDDVREVHREALELPAKSSSIKEIDFAFTAEAYGCELRALVEQDGELLSAKSEYFSVTDNLWKVCLGGGDLVTQTASMSQAGIQKVIEQAREGYCNWFEKFFWAPDDWGDLTPDPGATWFSCQARRHENADNLKLMIDTAHEHGMRAITYGKNLAGGPVGWELARRRPQWFLVDLQGRTQGRPATVWDMDHWHDEKYKYDDFSYVWTYRFVDLRRIDALDHGIDELIGSTKQFGWDGVRFDSSGFRAHLIDGDFNGHDAVNARNMKRVKERIRAVYPDYLFGYNTNNHTARVDAREYPLEPTDPMAHEMREVLAGGGLWMGEGMRDWNNGGVHYDSWRQFAEDSRRCIRTIKQYGGHFCYSYGLIGGTRKAQDQYKFVIGTMTGAHQYGMDHTKVGGSVHWGQFLTRWSGLVWHHGLRPLSKTKETVRVVSNRPLWWKEFANELVLSQNRRLVVVNLLNPPLDDAIIKTGEELPTPVDGCTVRFKVPRGQRLSRVFFIAPGSPNRAHALKPTGTPTSALVSVPAFDIWAMVVYELKGEFTPIRPGPNSSEPLSAQEQAELNRTTPTPMDIPPGFGNWPPAPTPTIRTAVDLLNPTPQHHPAVKVRNFGKAKVKMPDGLDVGGEPGLDVLIVKGFYHHLYRLPEAIKANAPEARIAECTRRDLPKEYADLFKYDVVVLADMGADAWDADGHKRLADYVGAGGRLVVLGGPFTLGQGYFKGTALERVLPVEVRMARDIYRLQEPLAIGNAKLSTFTGRPLLYYYHAVRPKADSKVRLWAGKLPVLLERKVGKGQVLVFIGTVLGDPQNKAETPFWEWKDWARTLGKLIL